LINCNQQSEQKELSQKLPLFPEKRENQNCDSEYIEAFNFYLIAGGLLTLALCFAPLSLILAYKLTKRSRHKERTDPILYEEKAKKKILRPPR